MSNFFQLFRAFKNFQNIIQITSDFTFTINVHMKPISKHSVKGGFLL